ncbi:MAG: protein phosphatase 2C domain-containing protein [Pyrinomonadaceae bacterium]|nr:protein phosphatase 2C domain-containing protein [Pyrinomonadaceae bacterium]
MKDFMWKIIAASVTGTSHAANNLPCQDTFFYEVLRDENGKEVLILVASDGAGSAKNSLTGAQITCGKFADECRQTIENKGYFDDLNIQFIKQFFDKLQLQLRAKAATDKQNLPDYACTFLAAIVAEETAVFAQIGDGAVVYSICGEPEKFCLATIPQQGEYANSTNFVTDANAAEIVHFQQINVCIEQIAIFTDGLQRIALDFKTNTPHAPFFRPMFAPLIAAKIADNLSDGLAHFLDSPKINERTDDDKTLILASRRTSQI